MEALLIDEWLRDSDAIIVYDEASLTSVRDRVREIGGAAAAPAEVVDRACLVATELGRNQLRHALAGRIAVVPLVRGEHRGVEIVAADRGTGIVDLAGSLDARARTSGTLGVGIGSVRRLASEVDFDVRLGEGTRVLARVLPDGAPRRREIGVYGRPIPEEKVSGDNACFVRIGETLVVGVCDGLGHGPAARQASHVAMKTFYENAREAPQRILEACHAALGKTRGVVMAICHVAEDAASLETASIGNVDVQLCAPRRARRFGGSSAVLGGRPTAPAKARSETAPLERDELLVMTTDGISSKLSIEQDLILLREHPVVVAQRIVEQFGRANDDALVLVAR